jgi:hypothetical protein
LRCWHCCFRRVIAPARFPSWLPERFDFAAPAAAAPRLSRPDRHNRF